MYATKQRIWKASPAWVISPPMLGAQWIVQAMSEEGVITAEEYENTVINNYYRSEAVPTMAICGPRCDRTCCLAGVRGPFRSGWCRHQGWAQTRQVLF